MQRSRKSAIAFASYILIAAISYCGVVAINTYVSTLTHATIFYSLLLLNGYTAATITYRLFLSPYAAFPGPKLAGATYWYTFYYDAIKGGQYMYQIEKLHMKYGPVLRISPNELHIIDADFYDVLFSQSRRNKAPTWSQAFGNPDSIFGTIDHHQHRIRRAPLNPYFSKGSIRTLEPLIREDISRLVSVFRDYQKTKEPVPLKAAFAALTSDIVTQFCFMMQSDYIEADGFNVMVLKAGEGATDALHVVLQFPWLVSLLKLLPDSMMARMLGPGIGLLQDFQRHLEQQIRDILGSRDDYRVDVKHKTIFHDILNSNLPEQDKSAKRLSEEAQTIVSAGTVTTATSLSGAFVYLLLDPPRLHTLMQELEKAFPEISKPPTHAQLENLPYLTAVIQETLRLGSGVSFRLTRTAPDKTLQCGDYVIPPNINMSTHAPLIHNNPSLFPSPSTFNPERWLPGGSANPKYLIPYSRGSRQCLGMHLASAELYMTIATILRTFVRTEVGDDGAIIVKGMSLWETDRRDVDMIADIGLPRCERGRGNVRVLLG